MGFRLILWFSAGPFRIAHRFPRRLAKYEREFAALESVLGARREAFQRALTEAPVVPGAAEDVEHMHGLGDAFLATFVEPASPDGVTKVVFRAALRFPWWPLGAWEVFDGLTIRPDGSTQPMSHDSFNDDW
jgi:hypothetical protein